MSKEKEITLRLTVRQAETLWMAIAGELDRDQQRPSVQRRLNDIGKRLSKAAGWEWRGRFKTQV